MSKRTTNTLLIIGAVILVIGLIIAGFGIIRGGINAAVDRFHYYQGKAEKISPVVIEDGQGTEVGEHFAEPISDAEIEVRVKAANVSIVKDTETWVEASNFRQGRLSCEVENDSIRLIDSEFDDDWSNNSYSLTTTGSIRETIVIHVNADSVKSLDLKFGAVDLRVDDFNVEDDFTIQAGAGNIAVAGGSAKELELQFGAGNIVFDNYSTGTLKTELGAAAMNYDGEITNKAKVSVGTGNVEMDVAGNVNDFYVEAEVALGTVKVDGKQSAGIGEFDFGNSNASKEMKLECGLGVIEIDFK